MTDFAALETELLARVETSDQPRSVLRAPIETALRADRDVMTKQRLARRSIAQIARSSISA